MTDLNSFCNADIGFFVIPGLDNWNKMMKTPKTLGIRHVALNISNFAECIFLRSNLKIALIPLA
jgi:hypothetical protein